MSAVQPRLDLAISLAVEASAMIRVAFAARQHVMTEKSANDFATETDAAVEAMMAQRISQAFPGDVLLGEEGGERALGDAVATGVRWIVDPLDGTFNFVHGFPYIATSMAVECHGDIEAGVIANPLTQEVFHCLRGGGAWRSDGADLTTAAQALEVSSPGRLDRALIASVLPSAASASFGGVLPAWLDVARACGSIRRTGAAALDLAHVAAGRLDGFFVMSLARWDAAAGALLVREAGGTVRDFAGGEEFLDSNQVIAGSRHMTEALGKVLQPYAKSSKRMNRG
jgi:myo-inositol-1(or 4)-monophosphatase